MAESDRSLTVGVTDERRSSAAARISTEVVRLVATYTGRGPTKARTTLNTNLAVVVLQDTLTRGEQNLVAAGEAQAVESTRRTFHDLMRPEAKKIVTAVLNREVVSCLAAIDPDEGIAALVFVLEPHPEDGRVGVAEDEE